MDGVFGLLLVYVDDLVCATNNEKWKLDLFAALHPKYNIKDLGRLHNYREVQVGWKEDGIFLHRSKYAKDGLERCSCTWVSFADGCNHQAQSADGKRQGAWSTVSGYHRAANVFGNQYETRSRVLGWLLESIRKAYEVYVLTAVMPRYRLVLSAKNAMVW